MRAPSIAIAVACLSVFAVSGCGQQSFACRATEYGSTACQ